MLYRSVAIAWQTFAIMGSVTAAEPPAARPSRRGYLVWAVAVLAYVLAVAQRTTFAVAGLDAADRFAVDPGTLSAFVFIQLAVYIAMQLPAGLLVDRFGSRTMLVASGLLLAAGQLLLAFTTVLPLAVLARVLVGAGDAIVFCGGVHPGPALVPGPAGAGVRAADRHALPVRPGALGGAVRRAAARRRVERRPSAPRPRSAPSAPCWSSPWCATPRPGGGRRPPRSRCRRSVASCARCGGGRAPGSASSATWAPSSR